MYFLCTHIRENVLNKFISLSNRKCSETILKMEFSYNLQ